jgi:hypothetical protein
MANQTLQRQIYRIQTELDVIKPKPPVTIKILMEPDPAIGGDNLLDFLLEVREAKKTHDHVLVTCHRWSDARVGQTLDGVRYFESDFAALCHKTSLIFTGDIRQFAMASCGNIVEPGPFGFIPLGKSQAA